MHILTFCKCHCEYSWVDHVPVLESKAIAPKTACTLQVHAGIQPKATHSGSWVEGRAGGSVRESSASLQQCLSLSALL